MRTEACGGDLAEELGTVRYAGADELSVTAGWECRAQTAAADRPPSSGIDLAVTAVTVKHRGVTHLTSVITRVQGGFADVI
jgi:hypothetical protein